MTVARGDANGARTCPHRVPRGERNGMAKLSEHDVRVIRQRRREGWTRADLADRYGVVEGTITFALAGETWGHVP